jgi:hypothetical protein
MICNLCNFKTDQRLSMFSHLQILIIINKTFLKGENLAIFKYMVAPWRDCARLCANYKNQGEPGNALSA